MTVKDLKNALLQEAVQGKLVPQISSEGNARDLLEEIRKEKLSHGLDLRLEASLAINTKSGKRKSKKETALAGSNPCDIKEDEIPFEIPENWCWCRLGDVIDVRDGTHDTPAYIKSGYPLITSKDFRGDHFDFSKTKYISKQDYDLINQRSKVEVGDILFSMIGGNIGNKIIITTENYFEMAIKNVALFKNNNNVYNVYLFYVLEYYTKAFQNYAVGGAQTFVSLNFIRNYPFPLPPLAEQKRIVAAIEKFMPLIEEYGKKETQLKAINEKICTLTKKAILQEAVQGKLVPQIAGEGNAKDLLEEIRKERLSHGLDFANAKSGKKKSKKETALAGSNPCDITEEEIPFDIPENWCWCRWGDLSESIQYGYNAPAKETGRIKMVRISDIHENKVFWDSVPYCDISEDEIQTYILKKNDILFARTGGTVGKSFLVQDVPCEAIYAGYLIRTHYNSEKLVPQYLKFFMGSNLYWEQLKEGTIATAQPNCNGKTLSKMLIPLPPLAEQKRIVAALEKFMPLFEQYEQKEKELTKLLLR